MYSGILHPSEESLLALTLLSTSLFLPFPLDFTFLLSSTDHFHLTVSTSATHLWIIGRFQAGLTCIVPNSMIRMFWLWGHLPASKLLKICQSFAQPKRLRSMNSDLLSPSVQPNSSH